jgi:beta-glucosidase
VLLPWADRAAAVVVVGLPGQEGGHAVAAALTGALEPAGRLVTSWPVADGATPAWSVTPVDGALAYREGPFVGYRGHAAGLAPPPRFWFGHGLGYGRWEHPSAELLPDGRAVAVTVRNTAARDAREVVQVYLEPADPDAPIRLVGWSVVDVAAGAAARVVVTCDARACRRWDTAAGAWAALPGPGALLVARGLGDVRSRLPLADLAPLADLPVSDPVGAPSAGGTGR